MVWWLSLLLVLEGAAWVLDSFHHMPWGRMSVLLLKAGYLFFAVILFFRYLSFRSQGVFESMVEAVNRITGGGKRPVKPKFDLYNPIYYLGLILVSSANILTLFRWREADFRLSLLLDAVIWMLVVIWVARVHLLKALGRKEKLKDFLDDARSRARNSKPGALELPRPGRKLRIIIPAVAAFVLTMALCWGRWQRSGVAFRVDSLKACLEEGFKSDLEAFYREGKLGTEGPRRTCLARRQDSLNVALSLRSGEPTMRAMESKSADYFGNGIMGDEGLELGPDLKFRPADAESP